MSVQVIKEGILLHVRFSDDEQILMEATGRKYQIFSHESYVLTAQRRRLIPALLEQKVQLLPYLVRSTPRSFIHTFPSMAGSARKVVFQQINLNQLQCFERIEQQWILCRVIQLQEGFTSSWVSTPKMTEILNDLYENSQATFKVKDRIIKSSCYILQKQKSYKLDITSSSPAYPKGLQCTIGNILVAATWCTNSNFVMSIFALSYCVLKSLYWGVVRHCCNVRMRVLCWSEQVISRKIQNDQCWFWGFHNVHYKLVCRGVRIGFQCWFLFWVLKLH